MAMAGANHRADGQKTNVIEIEMHAKKRRKNTKKRTHTHTLLLLVETGTIVRFVLVKGSPRGPNRKTTRLSTLDHSFYHSIEYPGNDRDTVKDGG